jgi:hypothetical protein
MIHKKSRNRPGVSILEWERSFDLLERRARLTAQDTDRTPQPKDGPPNGSLMADFPYHPIPAWSCLCYSDAEYKASRESWSRPKGRKGGRWNLG